MDIESEDGVANAAILESAMRIEQIDHLLRSARTVEKLLHEPSWPSWLRAAVDEAIE